MPWTCRKDRPPAAQRHPGWLGGGSGALMRRRRHQVHPGSVEDDVERRGRLVRSRRVWNNLFPVNGRSIRCRIDQNSTNDTR